MTFTKAPEVLSESSEITPSCDVFSMGIIMWEMLNQKLVYSDSNIPWTQITHRIVTEDMRPSINEVECNPKSEARISFFIDLMELCWDAVSIY